jgi:hypothetical protein
MTLSAEDPRHGTRNGYTKHQCRCDTCKAASSAYLKARRERRRVTTPVNPDDYYGKPGEEWAAIPEWEGLYEVSTLGRVRSVPHRMLNKRGDECVVRGRIRKQVYGNGQWIYPTVNLTDCETRRDNVYRVHVLVALAFIGPRPEGMQVRHRNGDYNDPRLVNLEYGTPSENQYDAVHHGTHVQAKKTHCKRGNHPLSGENLYVSPDGKRTCKTCRREGGSAHARRARLDRKAAAA